MTTDTETPRKRPPTVAPDDCRLPPPQLRQELRKIAGLTQEDIALRFGVSDGAVSYWERRKPGRRYLGRYLLLLVSWAEAASAMGLPVGWPAPTNTDTQK